MILSLNLVYKHSVFIEPYSHYSDPELISLWQQGNESAFDIIYKRYVGFLYNEAIIKTDSSEDAKELVQDVFLSLYLRKNDLQTITTLKAYLFTILKNKVINAYRKKLSQRKYEKEVTNNLRIVTDDPHEDLEAKELNQLMKEKINDLPPKCREVFLLSREEQLSYKEIAEKLNISTNTVDQHIQKALRILRASASGMLLVAWWMRGW